MILLKKKDSILFKEKDQIRAWQAHKIETKTFIPLSGLTKIVLVEIIDFYKGIAGQTFEFLLDVNAPSVLFVPSGYANGLQSKSADSSLMIFSNLSLEDAKRDDFRFEKEKFYIW